MEKKPRRKLLYAQSSLKLEDEIVQFLDDSEFVSVGDPGFDIIAPKHAAISRFINLDALRVALPPIPERMKEFSFRYAIEPKSSSQWAREFDVAISRIVSWKADPRFQAWVSAIRSERRLINFGKWLKIENLAFVAMENVLQARVTSTNLPVILSASRYVLDTFFNKKSEDSDTGGGVKINLGIHTEARISHNSMRSVGPDVVENLDESITKELEAHLEERKGILKVLMERQRSRNDKS